jgi:quercetin dioxygenase-like cupin family protein
MATLLKILYKRHSSPAFIKQNQKRSDTMQSGLLAAGSGPATWVVGDLYTIKASGRETGGAFCLIEVIVPPKSGPPPHIHSREDEAFYIVEGQFKVSIDSQELTAGPGSWVQLARGSLHHFKNVGTSSGKMLILASPAGLDQFFLEAGREASTTTPEVGAPTEADVQRLLDVAPKYGIEIKLPG